AHKNLAFAYLKGGRTDDALREYNRAIAIPPPVAAPHSIKGAILQEKGLYGEAMVEFKKALEIDPNYALGHRYLWAVYRQKGMTKEALAEIQKAIELDPEFAEAYNDLGVSLGEMKRFDE